MVNDIERRKIQIPLGTAKKSVQENPDIPGRALQLSQVSVSVSRIDFGIITHRHSEEREFIVSNSGSGILSATITCDKAEWVKVTPSSFEISRLGEKVKVRVKLTKAIFKLQPNETYTAVILIQSNDGKSSKTVVISFLIPLTFMQHLVAQRKVIGWSLAGVLFVIAGLAAYKGVLYMIDKWNNRPVVIATGKYQNATQKGGVKSDVKTRPQKSKKGAAVNPAIANNRQPTIAERPTNSSSTVPVIIRTSPPGAKIYLNHKQYLGDAPQTVSLKPDSYGILLVKEGYGECRGIFRVELDTGTLNFDMSSGGVCNVNSSNASSELNPRKTSLFSDEVIDRIAGSVKQRKIVNGLVAAYLGHPYHVATDADLNWSDQYVVENFIKPRRKENPDYPYLVSGDFNGDALKPDYAAFVIGSNKSGRLVIFHAGESKPYDLGKVIPDGIDFKPKQNLKSGWESDYLNMKGDGIVVFKFESYSVLYYWDGYQYAKYRLSD